jgi:hypothetical protein
VALGKGKMIYGGTKYKTELSQVVSVLPLVAELRRAGRVLLVDDARVDETALELKRRFPEPKFNDEHIAAIVIVSRGRVVCTKDKVATAYLKTAGLFRPFGTRRPKIYRSSKNSALCCDMNII